MPWRRAAPAKNVFTISSRVCSRGLGRSAALQILAIAMAMSVVCASQPIPNRIPHTFIRDHEHVLSLFVGTGVCVVLANGWLAHFL